MGEKSISIQKTLKELSLHDTIIRGEAELCAN